MGQRCVAHGPSSAVFRRNVGGGQGYQLERSSEKRCCHNRNAGAQIKHEIRSCESLMTLPIPLDEIYFGERDGLHEFMKQDKLAVSVLDNSFVNPPKIKMNELLVGARYIIVGPKGAGKTTLLWHLKRNSPAQHSKVVLFKSNIRKEDRDQLDRLVDLIVVEDQRKFVVDTDYKTIWEWYILKNILRLISPSDIIEGIEIYQDLLVLLEVSQNKFNTIYDKLYLEKVKGSIKINVDVGVLKSEVAAEIEARKSADGKLLLLDAVRLVQEALPSVRIRSDVSVRVFFDELEFFMSEDGDGERDRRMVRDIIFACSTVNTLCANSGLDIVVYASIRSEIIRSIESTGQEVGKLISAFGVNLDWYSDTVDDHPVLSIFENKIRYSEVYSVGEYTEDVWSKYFPLTVHGKEVRKYLLDMGLHRPRGVLLRITAALEKAHGRSNFTEDNFLDSEDRFGELMLDEYLEEISATLDEGARFAVASSLRGNHYAFERPEYEQRLRRLAEKDKAAKNLLEKVGVDNTLKLLFRVGIIGNHFDVRESGHVKNRQIWSFRGVAEPLLDQRFVVHQSVRKVLATK